MIFPSSFPTTSPFYTCCLIHDHFSTKSRRAFVRPGPFYSNQILVFSVFSGDWQSIRVLVYRVPKSHGGTLHHCLVGSGRQNETEPLLLLDRNSRPSGGLSWPLPLGVCGRRLSIIVKIQRTHLLLPSKCYFFHNQYRFSVVFTSKIINPVFI